MKAAPAPGTLGDSIRRSRLDLRLSQEEFGKVLGGFSRSAVSKWERDEQPPSRTSLEKLSALTGTPVSAYLSFYDLDAGEVPEDAGILPVAGGLPVVGRAAAGVWKEGNVNYQTRREPVAPNAAYPAHAQRLWEIEGTSINRLAREGEYLHAVNVQDAGLSPQDGDLVIVRRMEHGLAEYTAKVLTITGDTYRLRPDSTDPQWQGEFILGGDESTEIEIIDIVIAKWVPIGRGRRV
jgi:transcriptional regulator with XRE-family HTH domain